MTGLEALREHHLASCREQAAELIRGARAQAQEIATNASADAARLIETARRDGESAADLDLGREWTSSRRRATAVILAAQRASYGELRGALAAAIRSDPRYPDLLGRMATIAHQRLGPGAEVHIDRHGDGGVVATRTDRRIECSLASMVDASLDQLGPAIREMWR
jgi:vacuolar-type H+-ATPase subunit E/Vma4